MRRHTEEEMEIIPSGGALGAEVIGLDLAQPLSASVVRRLRRTLLDYGVVYFRGQALTDEAQVRFTGYFGRPVPHVRPQPERPVREIFIISNVEEDGRPIGALGHDEIAFHADLSYMRKAGTISVLHALEVPRSGGATRWCNCHAAYEALDTAMKERLKGLRAVHRHPIESQNPPEPAAHPVVRTHPETGRRSLYVSPHMTRYIVGMSEKESRRLLDALFDHLLQPRFIWTHDWRAGDVVMWDNRFTMHRREPFPRDERRIMKRTQVFNDEVPYE